MKRRLTKYFWGFNNKAVKETEKILSNPRHPKFIPRLITLLSRCEQPKKLFVLISKKDFVEVWPKVKSYWIKLERVSDFRDWWDVVYEQILEEYGNQKKAQKGRASYLFVRIGKIIRETRIQKMMSQSQLALRVGMKQPDISNIEEGKKNITLETLALLCKVLGIRKIEL